MLQGLLFYDGRDNVNRPVVVINARADAMLQPKMRTQVSRNIIATVDLLCIVCGSLVVVQLHQLRESHYLVLHAGYELYEGALGTNRARRCCL